MKQSKAQQMAALRLKRHKAKQIYVQCWINQKDEDIVLKYLAKYRIDKPKKRT